MFSQLNYITKKTAFLPFGNNAVDFFVSVFFTVPIIFTLLTAYISTNDMPLLI